MGPVSLLQRNGFIFAYIGERIHSLMAFREHIAAQIEDEQVCENEVAHLRTLPPFIEDCFRIIVLCITKLFKHRPFELPQHRKLFDVFLSNLIGKSGENESFTQMSPDLVALLEEMIGFVDDINIVVAIVTLMDCIMKSGRFDKQMRVDSKLKIANLCNKMLRGQIGEGYIAQIKNASNVGKVVAFYLRNCDEPLKEIKTLCVAVNGMEDRNKNKFALLDKKTSPHFLKSILDFLVSSYSQCKIESDIDLHVHSKIISIFGEATQIIVHLNDPKSIGHLMQIAATLAAKC